MAGVFVFLSRKDGKQLLKGENPEVFQQSLRTVPLRVGKNCVDKITFQPEQDREIYMESTGAKLFFSGKVALLSGYAYHGKDVLDLVQKYHLQTYRTEADAVAQRL